MKAEDKVEDGRRPRIEIEADAFADGQIGSKLWLCEELERLAPRVSLPATLWILGGWYGLLSFLLMSRGALRLANVRSFDVDEEATRVANLLNKNWEIEGWRFRAFTKDANELEYEPSSFGPAPHIVVNTSSEHFGSLDWWRKIPPGKMVAIQSTDMPHADHLCAKRNLSEMKDIYAGGLSEILFAGAKEFSYPEWSFRRFMLIGIKGPHERANR